MIKTLKNIEVLNILIGLSKSDIKSKQMPVSFLWSLKCNLKKLEEVNKLFEDSRQELINNYSTDDKSFVEVDENNHEQRKIKPEFQESWVSDNNELLNQETEFEFKTVDIDSLNNITMSPTDFDLLSLFMFEI